jgi:DNA-binding MarR family transcriptional regulator
MEEPSVPEDPHGLLARRTQELVRLGAELGGRLVTEAGVPLSDARALRLLDEVRDRPLTPGEVARELGLSAPAVTALVDRLVAVGLVERSRDAADRRRVHLRLTTEGRSLGTRLLGPLARAVDTHARALDRETAAAITRYLENVMATVREDPRPGPVGQARAGFIPPGG